MPWTVSDFIWELNKVTAIILQSLWAFSKQNSHRQVPEMILHEEVKVHKYPSALLSYLQSLHKTKIKILATCQFTNTALHWSSLNRIIFFWSLESEIQAKSFPIAKLTVLQNSRRTWYIIGSGILTSTCSSSSVGRRHIDLHIIAAGSSLAAGFSPDASVALAQAPAAGSADRGAVGFVDWRGYTSDQRGSGLGFSVAPQEDICHSGTSGKLYRLKTFLPDWPRV